MADEALKIVKATATNVSGGPKVFNSAPPVILGHGQSTDGEVVISEAELASMKATGYFKFAGEIPEPKDGDKPDAELLRAAVEGLDATNDDHWTAAGLPDVSAVSEAMGVKVTRAQIEAAAPDVKRPA